MLSYTYPDHRVAYGTERILHHMRLTSSAMARSNASSGAKAPSSPMDDQEIDPLIVSVKQDGAYFLDLGSGDNVQQPLDTIKEKVAKVMRVNPKTPVLVWGDARVPYGVVVKLMSELQVAGAPSVGLVTEPPSDIR